MYGANILTSTKSQWFILSLFNMPSGVLDMAQKKKIKQKFFWHMTLISMDVLKERNKQTTKKPHLFSCFYISH